MRISEGGIELSIPAESTDGIEADVFYNPRQVLNRDITIAVLREVATRYPEATTYLDGMTASGVRGIRAAKEGWEVTCCDRNPMAASLARENARLNDVSMTVLERNVNAVLHESSFDVVDLDPFGTPMPYADAAFSRCRSILCVTATDTAPLCGAHQRSGIRSYGGVSQNTEYHPEMGVRTLLSGLARSAARFDVGITPLLTHASSHYVRTYLELSRSATDADASMDALGYLTHCEECLYREHDHGLIPQLARHCPSCDSNRVLHAGPLWLEPIRDRSVTAAVADRLDDSFETTEKAISLLGRLESELDEPTHYDHHRLCKLWGRSAISLETVLECLKSHGFAASRTHYSGTSFKTTACVDEIESVTEALH